MSNSAWCVRSQTTGLTDNNCEQFSALESSLLISAELAVDPEGRLHFVVLGNHSVRRIELDGRVKTVVGEDHPASPSEARRLFGGWPPYEITVFAGSGTPGFSGDGGLATEAFLANPRDVCVRSDGAVLSPNFGNGRVRKVDLSGVDARGNLRFLMPRATQLGLSHINLCSCA